MCVLCQFFSCFSSISSALRNESIGNPDVDLGRHGIIFLAKYVHICSHIFFFEVGQLLILVSGYNFRYDKFGPSPDTLSDSQKWRGS